MKRRPAKPGSFVYHGGMVFEIDNCGRQKPRKDIGPGTRGKFKNKHFTGRACKR